MNAAESLWDELELLGFEREDRPEGYLPMLPADITELTEQQLMQLFGKFVAWKAYAASQLVTLRARENAAKQNLAYATAQAALKATTEKTVAGRKAAAQADEQVQADAAELVRLSNLVEGLEMAYSNAADRGQFCSREVSRRQSSRDLELRAGRWTA